MIKINFTGCALPKALYNARFFTKRVESVPVLDSVCIRKRTHYIVELMAMDGMVLYHHRFTLHQPSSGDNITITLSPDAVRALMNTLPSGRPDKYATFGTDATMCLTPRDEEPCGYDLQFRGVNVQVGCEYPDCQKILDVWDDSRQLCSAAPYSLTPKQIHLLDRTFSQCGDVACERRGRFVRFSSTDRYNADMAVYILLPQKEG